MAAQGDYRHLRALRIVSHCGRVNRAYADPLVGSQLVAAIIACVMLVKAADGRFWLIRRGREGIWTPNTQTLYCLFSAVFCATEIAALSWQAAIDTGAIVSSLVPWSAQRCRLTSSNSSEIVSEPRSIRRPSMAPALLCSRSVLVRSRGTDSQPSNRRHAVPSADERSCLARAAREARQPVDPACGQCDSSGMDCAAFCV